jgi:metal-responsive CopG/Arc/MetJ family transcriptional regulator
MTKPVQISLDTEILAAIDADEEVKQHGRSAFMRHAVQAYLKEKERRAIDEAIRRAYANDPDAHTEEVRDFMEVQAWPED